MKCPKCRRDFPDHMIQPLVLNDEPAQMLCPLCALTLRNLNMGFPAGTPFKGEMANELYEEALEYLMDKDATL